MMALAEQDPVTGWIDRMVMDRDGEQLGSCTGVLGDDGTGLPQWLSVEVGLGTTWVPAPGTAVLPEQVWVAVSRAEIANAPLIMQDHPSEEEKAALYGYYGIVPPVNPSARRRWLLLAAGALGGLAALAGAVLARRHLQARLARARRARARQARARQVRGGADVLLRGTRAVVSAVPVAAAPAAEVGGQVAARAAGLAAAAGRKGAETGVTVARTGASAARSAGARAAQVAGTAAGAAVSLAAAAGSSGARGGKRVSESVGSYQRWFQRAASNCRSEGGK